MKKSITTEIIINAKASDVWNVLMDFENYPKWNPFVKEISGDPMVGKKIKISLPGMKFNPVVKENRTNELFQWKGKFLVQGVFDGRHSFRLVDNGDQTTTFIHSEDFSGLLVSLMSKKLDNETVPYFKQMNEALKHRVEEG